MLHKALTYYALTGVERDDAIVKADAGGGYSMKEIGAHFGLHYSRVSRIVGEGKRQDLPPLIRSIVVLRAQCFYA